MLGLLARDCPSESAKKIVHLVELDLRGNVLMRHLSCTREERRHEAAEPAARNRAGVTMAEMGGMESSDEQSDRRWG